VFALVPLYLITKRSFPKPSADEAKRIKRSVGAAMIIETIIIIGGAAGVEYIGRRDLLLCTVAAGVGIHFIPMARWMPLPTYYLTGLALLVAACVGVWLPEAFRDTIIASLASAILWVTAMNRTLALPRQTLKPV